MVCFDIHSFLLFLLCDCHLIFAVEREDIFTWYEKEIKRLLLFIFSIKNFLINFSIKFFHRTFSLYSCTLISKLEIILGLHCISKEAWFCFVFILNNILLSFVFSKLLWYQNFSLIFFFQLVSATICLLLTVCLLKLQSYNLEKFK